MDEPKLKLEISIDLGDKAGPRLMSQFTRQFYQDIAKTSIDLVTRSINDEVIEG